MVYDNSELLKEADEDAAKHITVRAANIRTFTLTPQKQVFAGTAAREWMRPTRMPVAKEVLTMAELIDRQAALKKMCETCGYCERFENAMRSTHPDFVTDKCNNYKFLAEQPTIEAEPVKRGHWIWLESYGAHGTQRRKCSECGEIKAQEETNCCPNCGARMNGGVDNGCDISR